MRGCSAQWSESGLSAGNHHEPELRDACQASRSCRHGDGQLLDCGCRLLRVVWWTQRIGARAAFGSVVAASGLPPEPAPLADAVGYLHVAFRQSAPLSADVAPDQVRNLDRTHRIPLPLAGN